MRFLAKLAAIAVASATVIAPAALSVSHASASAHKTMVIVGENHSLAETQSSMPYLTGLGNQFGHATGYHAVSHPSLPNYLAIWGGSTFGVTSDCSVGSGGCVPTAPSVWGQTLAANETAKAYQEDMTSNCQTGGSGNYAPRHGPWPYWTDSAERSGCNANDVPMGTTSSGNLLNDINSGSLPVTGEMTPNLCNDAHDCGLATMDNWLKGWIPKLMSGPDYQSGNLTIIVTFDEDDGSQGNNVVFVAIDPSLSGVTVSSTFNHYSLTKWLDDNAGVSELRNAAAAPDLRAAFGLGGPTPSPTATTPTPTPTTPTPSPTVTPTPTPTTTGGACPVAGSTSQEQDLIAAICNVPSNAQYGLKDSAGNSMDTVKVISTSGGSPKYVAVYQSCATNPCHVLLAGSSDLRSWAFKKTLSTSGSQPTIKRLTDGSYLMAYEGSPSHLVTKRYSTLANLLGNVSSNSFSAPDTLGSCQGTPNIYSPVNYTSPSASKFHIGFHWSQCANDQEGTAKLTNFNTWCAVNSAWLNTALTNAGAVGKHGDRDAIWHGARLYDVVEGNTSATYSPANWRLYAYGFTEGAAVQVPVHTAGGSTAFANPAVTALTGPDGTAKLVISTFIPSQGAAPGEGGELLYTVPDTLLPHQGSLPSVIGSAC